MPEKPPICHNFVCALGTEHSSYSTAKLYSSAIWECNFLTAENTSEFGKGRGGGGGEASELHCDSAVETSHVVFTIVHLNCTCKKQVECLNTIISSGYLPI